MRGEYGGINEERKRVREEEVKKGRKEGGMEAGQEIG